MCDYNRMRQHSEIRPGDLIDLKGVTGHGKNRINQHGKTWRVREGFSWLQRGALNLESLEETFGGFSDGHRVKDGRWVHPTNDQNFEVTKVTREGVTLWEK